MTTNDIEKYKLYLGDCLEVMDKLIEKGVKVDMILTDPPFGTTACKWDIIIPFNRYIVVKEGKKEKILYKDEFMLKKFKEGINIKEAEKEWQENSKEGMWDKINKLIKPNGAVLLFGNEPFSSELRLSNKNNYKYDWYWNKNRPSGVFTAKKQPLKAVDTISVFYKKQCVYNPQMIERTEEELKQLSKQSVYTSGSQTDGREWAKTANRYDSKLKYPKNILNHKTVFNRSKEKVPHPTQKPVDLMEYLIITYTNEGDLVLDFTMGSGSTGVACMNTNRRFIGIELDEKYFNIAKERIENNKVKDAGTEKVITETDTAKKQKKLF